MSNSEIEYEEYKLTVRRNDNVLCRLYIIFHNYRYTDARIKFELYPENKAEPNFIEDIITDSIEFFNNKIEEFRIEELDGYNNIVEWVPHRKLNGMKRLLKLYQKYHTKYSGDIRRNGEAFLKLDVLLSTLFKDFDYTCDFGSYDYHRYKTSPDTEPYIDIYYRNDSVVLYSEDQMVSPRLIIDNYRKSFFKFLELYYKDTLTDLNIYEKISANIDTFGYKRRKDLYIINFNWDFIKFDRSDTIILRLYRHITSSENNGLIKRSGLYEDYGEVIDWKIFPENPYEMFKEGDYFYKMVGDKTSLGEIKNDLYTSIPKKVAEKREKIKFRNKIVRYMRIATCILGSIVIIMILAWSGDITG